MLLASSLLACHGPTQPSRTVEPRFDGGLGFSECPPPDAAEILCRSDQPADSEEAQAWVEQAEGGAERSRRTAVAALLVAPDAERLGRTSRQLERIVGDRPSPAALNDLAVTLLLRSRAGGGGLDLFRALEAVEIAGILDAEAEEPPFNLALILETLGLRHGAAEAWHRASSVARDPGWRGEAEGRRAALGPPIREPHLCVETGQGAATQPSGPATRADRSPWTCHRQLIERLLPALARAGLEGGAGEDHATRRLAERLDQLGDPQGVVSLRSWGDSPDRRHLEAVVALGEGLGQLEALEVEAGHESLERALAELQSHGDPLWLSAALGLVVAESYTRSEDALERAQWLAEGPARGFPAVLGRLEWLIGTLLGRQGDYVGSRAAYSRALAELEPIFGHHPAGYLRVLVGEVSTLDGRLDESWQHFVEGLPQVLDGGSPRRRHAALATVGQALAEYGFDHAARRVFVEATANAESWGSAYGLSASWRGLALAEHRLGRGAAAQKAIRRARQAAATIEDSTLRELTLADLEVDAVELASPAEEPAERRARRQRLARATTVFRESEASYDEVRALLAQVEVLGRGGERSADPESLALLERARALTSGVQPARIDRPGAVGAGLAERVARRRAMVLAAAGRIEDSLWAIERALLLASGLGTEPAPDLAAGLVRRAAEGDAVILVLGAGLGWTITADGISLHRGLGVEDAELVAANGALRTASVARRRELLRSLSGKLLPSDLPIARRYVVAAGRAYAGIPFVALEHPQRGVPLVDFASVGRAPALSLLLASPEPGVTARAGRALVVAATTAEGMSALPATVREVQEVADHFVDPIVIDEATGSELLDLLPQVSLFHFSGHLRADPLAPFRQQLLLGAEHETLGLGSILGLDLSGLRLVVLASCDSGVASSGRFRGPSYAQAFLLGGSHQVVGTLWPVEDRASRELMVDFWRQVADGALPIDALAEAARRARTRAADEAPVWMAYGIEGNVLTLPGPLPGVP